MKLVRDRIGDIPWPDEQAKQHLGWVAPDSPEYRELLRAKLREECAELVEADRRGDAEAVLDEAADVYEVLRALLVAGGVTTPIRADHHLVRAAEMKLAERGGFFQGRTWSGPERAGHPASSSITMYAMHDHGEGTERHAHSTSQTHSGDINNPHANDHTGVTVMPWDEWRRAIANPCCGGTGFADYAAVPCPNPTCTAPPMGGKIERIVEDMAAAAERGAVPFVHMIEDPERRCTCPVDPDGPERGDPLSTCLVHGWTTSGNTNAEAERLWGHPLQYAHVGRVMVNNSERMSDAEVRAAAGPTGASGLPIERTNRCPTCEQWSPCSARPPAAPRAAEIAERVCTTWVVGPTLDGRRFCLLCGWPEGDHTAPTTPPASTEAGEDASAVGEDAPEPQRGAQAAEEYTGRCPKCFSKSWVSVSLNGGYTRVPQCVPCGAIHAHTLGPGWRAW